MSPVSKPSRTLKRGISLPIALGLSLALHAGFGVALGIQSARSSNSDSGISELARFDVPEDLKNPRFITLGNPDSRTSSLTWIGYDEFEEMWAPPSEVDQAQQTMDEPGLPMEPLEREAELLEDTDKPVQPEAESEMLSETDPVLELESEQAHEDRETEQSPGPDVEVDYARLTELVEAIEGVAALLPRFNPTSRPTDQPPRQREAEAPTDAAPATDAPSADDGASPSSPPDSGEQGDPSDRESDAATVNPVQNADLGRPLAAEGLIIRTVRPTFSNVTLATARPRNPVVQIDFRRNGMPIRVFVIESSGHEQVDLDIRTTLYRWRASGAALEQLPEPEDKEKPAFVSIKLQIIL